MVEEVGAGQQHGASVGAPDPGCCWEAVQADGTVPHTSLDGLVVATHKLIVPLDLHLPHSLKHFGAAAAF